MPNNDDTNVEEEELPIYDPTVPTMGGKFGLFDESYASATTIPEDVFARTDDAEINLFGANPRASGVSDDVAALDAQAVAAQRGAISSASQKIAGVIPQDVQDSVLRTLSETSIQRGVFGQKSRALSARDLGTTSMELSKQGSEDLERYAKLAEVRREFDVKHSMEKEKFLEDVRRGVRTA